MLGWVKRLVILAGLVLLLGGCAPAEAPEPVASESVTQSPQEEQPEELTTEEIIIASHDKFFAEGMTERVESGGDNYILSYAPTEEFVAALYNETFDDVISVSERGMFTVLSAYDALQSGTATITQNGNLITIETQEFGSFEVTVENGLIVSGRDLSDSWSGTFEYAPDAETLERLQGQG